MNIFFIQIIFLIRHFGIYKVRARLSKFLEYIKWENMSGKVLQERTFWTLYLISEVWKIYLFFFKVRKNARALYANDTATRQSGSKEMFFSTFLYNSNFEIVLLIWWTLPIAFCISRKVIYFRTSFIINRKEGNTHVLNRILFIA